MFTSEIKMAAKKRYWRHSFARESKVKLLTPREIRVVLRFPRKYFAYKASSPLSDCTAKRQFCAIFYYVSR